MTDQIAQRYHHVFHSQVVVTDVVDEYRTFVLLFFLFHLTSSEENKIILDTEYLIIASNNIKRINLPVPINFDDELLSSRLLVARRS